MGRGIGHTINDNINTAGSRTSRTTKRGTGGQANAPTDGTQVPSRPTPRYWEAFWQGGPTLSADHHAQFLNDDPSPPPPPPPLTPAQQAGLRPAAEFTRFADLRRGDQFTVDEEGPVWTSNGAGTQSGWAESALGSRNFSLSFPVHSVLREGEAPAAVPPAPTTPPQDTREPWQQTLREFAADPRTMWHGTPYGTIGEGELPIVHLGDWKTAHEALAARIRNGYAGKNPVVPEECEHGRPAMHPLRITGPMHAGVARDFLGDPMRPGENSAEGRLRGMFRRRARPRKGYFYRNEGEGVRAVGGRLIYSTSAVVPHPSWLTSHEDLVRDAVRQGHDVPGHVLAEYPHLQLSR
jgi:hypothetical protein